MGERMRAFDWSQHPLGNPTTWPQPIKAAIGIMLNSRFPMFVWVGRELYNFYNDAYIPVLGKRHPDALGRPAEPTWKEIWPVVGPQAEAVFQHGASTWNERVYLGMERNGFPEDTWFTWSYSPIPDEQGNVVGLFCACTEDTARVVAERERNRFADRLKSAYNLLDSVAESSQDLIAAIDHGYRFIALNSAYRREFERVFGPKIAIGDNLLEALAHLPDDQAHAKALWGRALAGETVETTADFGDPDRQRRTFDLRFYPIRNSEGKITGAGEICTDITERRQIEQQAKIILESVTDAFFSVDSNWRFTYLNPRAEHLLDCTSTELVGKNVWQVYPGLIGSPFEDIYRRTAAERIPNSDTAYYPDHERWYEVRSYPSSNGISVYFRDVTEARRAEAAIRRTEERFRMAVEAVNGIIYEYDLVTDQVERTRGFYEVLGYHPNEVPPTGTWWREQIHPDDLQNLDRLYVPSDSLPGSITLANYRVRHKDGRWLHLEDRSVLMRDPSGQPLKIIGCSLDVTQRTEATKNLLASERRFRFLSELGEQTREASSPDEVLAIVAEALGRYLNASRCAYAEVETDANQFTILHDYTSGCETTKGSYHLELFGSRAVADLYAGRTFVVKHVDQELPNVDGGDMFRAINIQAIICCPLVQGGKLSAMMAVHQTTPRDWTEDEIRLVEVVVERCWAYVERARAEGRVRQSEARFREFADTAPAMLWITEPDGYCSFLSLGWYEFTGQTQEEGLGLGWTNAVHPDDREAVRKAFLDANAARAPFVSEHRLMRADGGYSWVIDAGRARRDAAGNFLGYIGSVIDIDQRVRAETALKESRARLDLVVNSSQIGLWYCDLPFDKLDWNPTVKEHFGLPPDYEVTMDVFRERLHPDDRDRTQRAIEKALFEKSDYDIEYRTIGLDGRERWIRAIGRAHYDAQGKPSSFDGVTIDVTERVHQAEALREADRRKDEFLATLAHELRNPLAPLRHGLELIGLAPDDSDLVAEARDIMQRQLAQMVRLIDDLLDLSRISRGKIELRKERVELGQVLASAMETSEPIIRQARHEVTLDLPSEPILLDGDFTRLAQVFGNLLNNAARYSEPGGRIDIVARRSENTVEIAIADQGIGIPSDMLTTVFEMFTQVDRSLEKSRGGLGIGLTLVKRFVELHGGSVSAQSGGRGQGSTFSVTLPVLSTLDAAAKPEVVANSTPLGGRRILVVDDNRDAAVSLSRMLHLMGNETQVAHDGLEALQVADAFRPDVVLLDIGMPKLNGYDTAMQLRKRPWGSQLTLVALTGWGQEEDRRRSYAAGFDEHLVKPIDRQALETVVTRSKRTPD